jgi:hypothetical protein
VIGPIPQLLSQLGKDLLVKPDGTRRYHAVPQAIRTITALVILREVIAPILAGVRVPRPGRKPNHWTRTDQHYETLRREMKALLAGTGIAASWDNILTTLCRAQFLK